MEIQALDIRSLKALQQLYKEEVGAAIQQNKNKLERSRLRAILNEIRQYIREKNFQASEAGS